MSARIGISIGMRRMHSRGAFKEIQLHSLKYRH